MKQTTIECEEFRFASTTPKRIVLQLSLQYYRRRTVAAYGLHDSTEVGEGIWSIRLFKLPDIYFYFDKHTKTILEYHLKPLDEGQKHVRTRFI
ncbi:hypothetical protein [Pseudomonas putida]|uniref:hypothetical protein n=1 Tax=Pseudomonas putida TaxID=303 RepID=UPI00235C24D2|nr:hypothetical protein [Pseudomonas putida]GLO47112.1 hypothetical protein PPUN109347_36750 [Pseudomonas putida]HDS0979134.1 hypothetical protein [Pseudomonas putida]